MASIRKLIIIFLAFGSYVGCSDVEFANKPGAQCTNYQDQFGDDACSEDPVDGYNIFTYTVPPRSVDILFVDDNSGSMYPEQQEMGNRFPHFLNTLSGIDYRIAITTTDINKDKGNFLVFPDGSKVLTNTSSNPENQFKQTIQRPETLDCDPPGNANCPSNDERGIYAVNIALDRGDTNFFRKGIHFAVVILSDEDERSNGGKVSGYPLQDDDTPESLVKRMAKKFSGSKTISVHSVIIPPGDSSCYNAQDERTQSDPFARHGFFGEVYASLSSPSQSLKKIGPILDGEIGSICSNNYTNELGDIAEKIGDNIIPVALTCNPGEEGLSFTPQPPFHVGYTIDDNNILHLNTPLPTGTQIKWKCKPGI